MEFDGKQWDAEECRGMQLNEMKIGLDIGGKLEWMMEWITESAMGYIGNWIMEWNGR